MAKIVNIRERILELAVDAIDSGGEEAIRVNDIAADAGVTVPTLYRHFGSRDGLVEAAQTYRFRKTQFVDSSVLAASLAKCKNRDDLRKALRKELLTHFAGRFPIRNWRSFYLLSIAEEKGCRRD